MPFVWISKLSRLKFKTAAIRSAGVVDKKEEEDDDDEEQGGEFVIETPNLKSEIFKDFVNFLQIKKFPRLDLAGKKCSIYSSINRSKMLKFTEKSSFFKGSMAEKYALLDSGDQRKLERFGDYLIVRPCSQALWVPVLSQGEWDRADAFFSRDGGNTWNFKRKLPEHWFSEVEGVRFKISPTDFGHLGVFPEHSLLWKSMKESIRMRKDSPQILNLFAYSGGATLAAAQAGARVCHLDASKGMVAWARENAAFNQLSSAPIRWIVDDAVKFLKREIKRGTRYEGIILDPPSFGRGCQGEVFKIERDIHELLTLCRQLLSEKPLFLLFTTHTPGMTPLVMGHLMRQKMQGLPGQIETGEMILPADRGFDIPSGSFARWFSHV